MHKLNTITCPDWSGNIHTVSADEVDFRLAAYALMVQNGKLLVMHGSHGDAFSFLGGGLSKSELLEDCLKREVMEEAGLEVSIDTQLEPYQLLWWHDRDQKAYNCIFFFYRCSIIGGDLLEAHRDIDDNEVETPQWVEISKLKPEQMRGYNAYILRELIQRQRLIG